MNYQKTPLKNSDLLRCRILGGIELIKNLIDVTIWIVYISKFSLSGYLCFLTSIQLS